MQIVNAQHTFDLQHITHQFAYIDITRRGFEQNVHRNAQDAPGIEENENTDERADQRVEPVGDEVRAPSADRAQRADAPSSLYESTLKTRLFTNRLLDPFTKLVSGLQGVHLPVLVPNSRGLDRALALGVGQDRVGRGSRRCRCHVEHREDVAPDPPHFGPLPSIWLNSNVPYDFDYTNGIDADKYDFDAVVSREFGRVLGFISLVGELEIDPGKPLAAYEAALGAEKTLVLEPQAGGGRKVTVRIPAGVDDGETIRVPGQGRPGARGGNREENRGVVTVQNEANHLVLERYAPHPAFAEQGEIHQVLLLQRKGDLLQLAPAAPGGVWRSLRALRTKQRPVLRAR